MERIDKIHLESSCDLGSLLSGLRTEGCHTDTRLVVEGGGEVVAHWPVLARSEAWNSLRRGREGGEEVVVLLPQYTRGEVEEWLERAYGLDSGDSSKKELKSEKIELKEILLKEESFYEEDFYEENSQPDFDEEKPEHKKHSDLYVDDRKRKIKTEVDDSFINALGLEKLVLDAIEARKSVEDLDKKKVAAICIDLLEKSEKISDEALKKYMCLGEGSYMCLLCQEPKEKHHLKVHVRDHHIKRAVKRLAFKYTTEKFECQHCGKKFKNRQSLQVHDRNLHSDKIKTCKLCGFTSTDYLEKKRHEREVHGTTERSCHICGIKFKSIQGFEHHVENKHGNNIYPCQECGKEYNTAKLLDDHFITIHAPKTKVCDQCGAKFAKNSLLKRHKLTHVDNPELFPFPCPTCPKRFKTKINVRDHVFIHTGEKPYECTECGMKFRAQQAFARHKRVVHEGYRPYICKLCSFTAGQSGSLTVHYRNVHGVERPEDDGVVLKTGRPAVYKKKPNVDL